MIALIEKNGLNAANEITIISADEPDKIRMQIERLLNSPLSATAWSKLYLDGETVDLGGYQIVLFETNSIIEIKAQTYSTTNINVKRDYFNLKPLD